MQYVNLKLNIFETSNSETFYQDFDFVSEDNGGSTTIILEIAGKKYEFNCEGELIKGK